METNLSELRQMADMQEACLKFGQLLGLDAPVPPGVLYAAMNDEDYVRNLLLSRRNADMLALLLRQAPAIEPMGPVEAAPAKHSNMELIGKATKALVNWGRAGFSTVEEAVYKKRLAACERCDQLDAPPDKLLYKISLKRGEDKRTCKACGCVVSRKARLTSDTCPLEDAANPTFNRWGESCL
jgi:hypothetical protein